MSAKQGLDGALWVEKNHNCCPEDNLILASLDLNNMHTGHCPFVGMWFQNIIMV